MNAPTAAKGGKAFSIQPVLKLIDSGGNTLEADSSSLVRVSIAANPSRGALKPTDALIAYVRKGFAVFRGLKIDKAGSGYSLRFTVYNKVEGKNQWKKLDIQNVTGTFDVLMGTPVSLYLQRNLSDGVLDGQPNEVQPVVALLDSGGNVVSSLETGSITAAMVSSASVSSSIVVDTSAAPFLTVSSVRAVTSASYPMPYGVGARVSIQVTFSDEVAVKGAPTLELASSTGGVGANGNAVCTAASSVWSTVYVFEYDVVATDSTADLEYTSTTALSLNGGTITDRNGKPPILTLPALGSTNSLSGTSAVVIDTASPVITAVTCTNPGNGDFGTGITVSSAPSTTVTRDNEVVISISFSALVTVDTTKGTPSLQMAVGDYNREAVHTSGNNTQALLFSYIVRLGDEAPNGLGDVASGLTYVSQSALTLNSGTALRFEYTIKTGDTARSLDYADTTALDVNGARILTCTANTNVAPTQNVDLHLNPPGGRLLGTTVKPVTFGKATFTDLVVDRLGFDYRVMFYTLSPYASGDNLGSSVDIDGNTLVLGGPGASEPIAAVQVVTALVSATDHDVEVALEKLVSVNDVIVQRTTSMNAFGGFSWTVTFVQVNTKNDYGPVVDTSGNLPALVPVTTKLQGTNARVVIQAGGYEPSALTADGLGTNWGIPGGSAVWSLFQTLSAAPQVITSGDRFGEAVAVSGSTTTTVAVGAPGYATDSGAVFVFDLVGGYFQSRQMLLQESPVMAPGDRFGNALDLDMFSTYTLVVGAHRHTFRRVGAIDAVDNGLALVFTRRSSNDILFALQQVLYGSDTRANDRFGTSVAVAKDTIVVGAHELYEGARTIRKPVQAITTSVLDSETTGIIQGGFFVLSFLQSNAGEDPTSMTTLKRMQTQSIVYDINPSGLEAILERDFEMTNIIVRRDGPSTSKEYTWYVTFADSSGEIPLLEADTTELLGAEVTVTQTIRMAPVLRGTAYAFTRDANGKWTEQASLFPRKKQYFAWFGSAVAVDKRTAIVGAPNLDTYVTGTNSGGGFVFDLGILSLRFSSKTYNVLEGDKWDVAVQRCSSYGAFCAIDVSAAPQLYINYDTGDAFSDRQSGPTYVAVDPQSYSDFSIAVSAFSAGNVAVVGAPLEVVVGASGLERVFVYHRGISGLWGLATTLRASDSVQYQILERTVEQEYAFGQALDMDRRTIIVGAPFSDGGAFTAQQYHSADFDRRFFGRGAVYIFHLESQEQIITLRTSSPLISGSFRLTATRRGVTGTTREIGYGSTAAEIKAALEGTDGRDGDGSTIEALGFRLLEVTRTGMIDQGFSWSVTFIGEILVIPVLTATWSGYGCTSCKAFSSSYATDPSRQVAVSETVAIGSKWRQQTRIMAPDGNPGDQFGFSVAISGEQTIVGAASSSALTSTTWDFETGDLTGWLTTGTAFDQQPTYGDNSYARINTYRPYQYPGAAPPGQSAHHEGRYWVGTFEARTGAGKATTAAQRAAQMCAFANDELCRAPNYKLPSASAPAGTTQGDGPQGTLISLPFTIEGLWMSFRVGGGCDVRVVYVELLIDGQSAAVPETVAAEQIAVEVTSRGSTTKPTNTARPVSATSKLRATGRCDEAMQEVTWDLSAFQNRSAQIRVVDASSSVVWGHINFDDVRFSWGATRVAQVSTSKAGEAYTFRRRAPGTQFPTAKCEGMNRWYCEWEFQARLIASDKRGEDRFGFNVAVDDTTGLAVISAPGQRAVDANNTIEHILTDGLDATGRAFAYDLAVAGVRFTNPWFACIEGNADGLVGLTLSRSAATSNLTRALTIGYATEDRSAVGVDAMKFAACLKIPSTQRKDCGDYQQIAGEVTFAAGETSKLVTIPIMEDTCFEQWEEHFVVRLHVPGGEPLLGEHFIARKFRKCFSGVEAVDWILQHKQARDTYEAVRKGQTLLDQHFITMVDGAAKFQCHPKRFYSFTSMATTA
ncbi:hypothetical protein JM16_003180 [Phytophthora kernoviae]|uniref:DEP domain-containing protein n=1 Tax=Phytophthora kernoviae TaxID=325452 RepID=A0A8T0M2U4_9STRA|nr:hypothetical protein JM16_003180 [Phytophthora kernoviae]